MFRHFYYVLLRALRPSTQLIVYYCSRPDLICLTSQRLLPICYSPAYPIPTHSLTIVTASLYLPVIHPGPFLYAITTLYLLS